MSPRHMSQENPTLTRPTCVLLMLWRDRLVIDLSNKLNIILRAPWIRVGHWSDYILSLTRLSIKPEAMLLTLFSREIHTQKGPRWLPWALERLCQKISPDIYLSKGGTSRAWYFHLVATLVTTLEIPVPSGLDHIRSTQTLMMIFLNRVNEYLISIIIGKYFKSSNCIQLEGL